MSDNSPIIHKHLAVIGRIPGQDEDTLLQFEEMTARAAVAEFTTQMYGGRVPDPKQTRFGETIYVTHLLVSDSPIYSIAVPQ